MHFARAALVASALITTSLAQTSTKCNPLHQTCPPDPALGSTANVDFTSGASSDFTSTGNGISYNSNGLALTVAKQGDAPTITSKWYIMFGRVSVSIKAAPGTGIVSSSVLQSDDLDEIDWEFLGGDSSQVQTNYFGKGITGSYNRATFVPISTSQSEYNTYTVDWTADQIVWQINGQTVRTLTPAASGGQYPQTPMQVRIGAWAGGDPSNSPGTIAWAGGPVNYAAGPFTMYVKSVDVTDYSTGSQYTYSDESGSWQSIRSDGGSIGQNSGDASSVNSAAPPTSSTTSGDPVPFQGTHADPSSAVTTPSIYPWVSGGPSMTTSALHAGSSVPSLPSGWTVSGSSSGAVSASTASSTYQAVSSTTAPSASSSAGSSSSSDEDAAQSGIYPTNNGTSITAAPSGTLATIASGSSTATKGSSSAIYTGAASGNTGRLDLAAAALIAAGLLVL